MTSRAYTFTIFFPSEDNGAALAEAFTELPPKARYMVWQLEATQEGRPHWQGYLQCTDALRMAAVKKMHPLFAKAHLEKAKGTAQQNYDYCTKDESRLAGPWFLGEMVTQGMRKDTFAEVIRYITENTTTMAELLDLFPVAVNRDYQKVQQALQRYTYIPPEPEHFVPRPWQQRVVQMLEGEPDQRHIIWVTDTAGGQGKSHLARHLTDSMKAISLSGQTKDMAFMYMAEMAPIAIFDISRAAVEYSDHIYSFAEKLKDGICINVKYQSMSMRIRPPHVICFSNQTWNRSKWTHDRVIEVDLSHSVWHTDISPLTPQNSADFDQLISQLPLDAFW